MTCDPYWHDYGWHNLCLNCGEPMLVTVASDSSADRTDVDIMDSEKVDDETLPDYATTYLAQLQDATVGVYRSPPSTQTDDSTEPR